MSIFKQITGHSRNETVRLKDILLVICSGGKSYIKWGIGGLFIGLIICFSIPKEYIIRVLIAPEKNTPQVKNESDNILIAALFSSIAAEDAYNETTYSSILNAIPFLHNLLSIKLNTSESTSPSTLQEILKAEKTPWWDIVSLITPLITTQQSQDIDTGNGSRYKYSEEEWELIETLRQKIILATIESTGAMELEVRLQDPIAAAQLADTVQARFEEHIHSYRIQKATERLEYAMKQENDTRLIWNQLQDSLGKYEDSHQKISSEEGLTALRRLRHETTLAYRAYQSAVLERNVAETNLYEIRPVFTTVSPATVPIKASRPRKLVIISYCMFFAVYISMVKILFTHSKKL